MYGFINHVRRGNAESLTISGGTVTSATGFTITGIRPSWIRVQRSVDLKITASCEFPGNPQLPHTNL